jgi:cobalamin synthase
LRFCEDLVSVLFVVVLDLLVLSSIHSKTNDYGCVVSFWLSFTEHVSQINYQISTHTHRPEKERSRETGREGKRVREWAFEGIWHVLFPAVFLKEKWHYALENVTFHILVNFFQDERRYCCFS